MSLSAAVIGTVFIDCKGFARDAYVPTGRNLGTIRFVHGGVGRNIAENMARMGVATALVSSVDEGALGREVIDRLRLAGVDTRYVATAERQGMGMWLAVLDENGELAGSISQMPDLSALERMMSESGDTIVRSSSHLLLELDLNAGLSRRVIELANRHGKPVYGIPGNLDVVTNYPELMGGLSCFVCNHIEAERLTGTAVLEADEAGQRRALMRYMEQVGLPAMVVTLGAEGALYAELAGGEFGHQPVFPVHVRDTSGAGDAFFSGTAMGLMRGLPLREAVVCGTKVAGWTIESPESNCLELGERLRNDPVLRALLPEPI